MNFETDQVQLPTACWSCKLTWEWNPSKATLQVNFIYEDFSTIVYSEGSKLVYLPGSMLNQSVQQCNSLQHAVGFPHFPFKHGESK